MVCLGHEGAARDGAGRPRDIQDMPHHQPGEDWVGTGWGLGMLAGDILGATAHLGLAYPEVSRGPVLILLNVPLHAW